MKINGVSLKAIKEVKDHDGLLFVSSANIYYGTKKIGTYEEDYYGGDAVITVLDAYKDVLKNVADNYFKAYPYGFLGEKMNTSVGPTMELFKNAPLEGLCCELSDLARHEKIAKKCFKKGYKYYAVGMYKETNIDDYVGIRDDEGLAKFKKKFEIYFLAEKDKNSFDFEI